jgi:hypothetical protein
MGVVGSLRRVVFWDPSWAVVRTLVRHSVEDTLVGLVGSVPGAAAGARHVGIGRARAFRVHRCRRDVLLVVARRGKLQLPDRQNRLDF